MIEKEILQYLQSVNIEGVGINVFVSVPSEPMTEYVVIERTGGGMENLINEATVAIQSVSSLSMLRAIEINESVKEALLAMPYSADVFSVTLNSDYNFTNTETKEYRYQAVFNISY